MALNLGELVAFIKAEDGPFQRTLGRVHRTLQTVGKAGALAGLAGSATTLVASLAPAVGILAALPAVWVANKAAAYAFGLAIAGVGDALSAAISGDAAKFEEALKEMPPAARSVVRELGGAFMGLQETAQSSFFKPMVKASKGMGKELRGPLHGAVASMTSSMGRFGAKLIGVVRQGATLSVIQRLGTAVGSAIDGASEGVGPLVAGIRDFVSAGLGGFGRAGNALGRLMGATGRWLSSMAASGRATKWINNAVTTLKTMGRIGRNVALTIGAIFKNAGAGASGGLLTTIEQITQKMLAWAQSAKGQQQITTFFTLLNQVAANLATILPLLAGPLGAIATIMQSLPAPTQGAATQMLAWALVIGFVTSRVGPLVTGLVRVGKVAGSIGKGVGKGLSKIGPHASRAASAMGRAAAAAGRAAARFAVAAGRMAVAAGRAALSVVAAGARMAASMAMTALRVAAGWLLMAVRATINAVVMAASWLVAFWPVALIVAAAGIAVFLIIKYWDKIKAFFTETLPAALRKGFQILVNLIKLGAKVGFFGPVGLIIAHWGKIKNFFTQTLPAALRKFGSIVLTVIKKAAQLGFLGPIGLIIAHWTRIKNFFTKTLPNAVRSGINRVTSFVRSLPGRIRSAVGNLGSLLVNAGRNVIQGLINGIKSQIGNIGSTMGDIASKIRGYLPFSPAKEGPLSGAGNPEKSGLKIAQMVAAGVARGRGTVADAMGSLTGGTAVGVGVPGRAPARAGASAAAAGGTVRVIIDTRGADGEMKRMLRKMVRVDGQGDVQATFGKAI